MRKKTTNSQKINDPAASCGVLTDDTTQQAAGYVSRKEINHALYLAALLQLRWNPKAKEYFEKKLKEGKTKKQALRCLMKRTACIVYGILKSGEKYRV